VFSRLLTGLLTLEKVSKPLKQLKGKKN